MKEEIPPPPRKTKEKIMEFYKEWILWCANVHVCVYICIDVSISSSECTHTPYTSVHKRKEDILLLCQLIIKTKLNVKIVKMV